MPTQTGFPTTGPDGRIKNRTGGQNVVLALMTSWQLSKPVQVAPRLDFESPTNAAGVAYPTMKYGTIGDYKVSIAGMFNINATETTQGSQTGLADGANVSLDLLVSKGGSTGYPSCTGIVNNFVVGQKMENGLCQFTCEVDCYGVPPTFGAVS